VSEEQAAVVQLSLIDEIQATLVEVKEKYAGDFNAAVEAAERKLGVLREARKYAGVKTEKRPRKAPSKRRRPTDSQTEA
jgi:hypothetical protein